ncbi:MAG: hypothetical protein WBZ36_13880 [Candidatus Nitrosopolaris sp.]
MVTKIKFVVVAILLLGLVPSAYAHSIDYQHGYKAGQQGGRNEVYNLGSTCEGYNFKDCDAGYFDGFFSTCKPLMPGDMQGCYDNAEAYDLGYSIGKQDAVSSLSNPAGGCSAPNDRSQQEIDACYQGYNYAYNHFCGIRDRPRSEYPCEDHTYQLAYIIGYNNAVDDASGYAHINNPPGSCSTGTLGDNANHREIEKCLKGYEDSYNYFCAMHDHAHSEYSCRIKYSVLSFSTSSLLGIAYGVGYQHGKQGGDLSGHCDDDFMGDNTTQQQMDRCEQGITDAYNHFCVHGTSQQKSQCSEA